MAPPGVIKLTLPSTVVRDCQQAIYDLLIANGFVDDGNMDNEPWQIARAAKHLAFIYGPDALVEIVLERTPAHYQVTVTQV